MIGNLRVWISWIQPTDDHRPLNYPPKNPHVLGWWCTGECDDGATLCAVVDIPSELLTAEGTLLDLEEAAKLAIQLDWPEASTWRFIEERPSDWIPNDRFPQSPWMKDRLQPQ